MCAKKLLILSSFGGYGHIAATNTLKALLGSEYKIDTAYPIKDLRILGMPSGEAFYNYTISNNWTAFTNWYTSTFSPTVFSRHYCSHISSGITADWGNGDSWFKIRARVLLLD